MPLKRYRLLKQEFLAICEMQESAHQIAMGAAIGIFVGFLPCMGIQMSIAVPLAFLFRANKLLAAAGVWFTNPVTFIPIYYGCYLTGTLVHPVRTVSMEQFRALADAFTVERVLYLGEQVVVPLLTGCVTLGLLFGTLTYLVVRRIVLRVRSRQSAD